MIGDLGVRSALAGVDGVGHDVQDGAMDALGVDHDAGQIRAGMPAQLHAQLGGAGLHQLDDVADRLVQVGRLERGLAVLGEGEHVHDQVVDLGLVLLDDRPAAADDRIVLLLEAQVDQVAAAADALEDVLDVMRERGDRLADGGESLGLDLVVVEDGVLDRQPGLVADGDHEHELVLAEPAALAGLAGRPWPAACRPGCRRRGRPAWCAAPGSARRWPRGSGSRRSTGRG